MAISVTPGNAATYIDIWGRCGGTSSLICNDRIDALWDQYQASSNLSEREDLIKDVQNILLDVQSFVILFFQNYYSIFYNQNYK